MCGSPELGPLIGDVVAKNLDWPGADEIAERLKAMLPPEIRALERGSSAPLSGGQGASLPPAPSLEMEQAMAMVEQLQAENARLQQQAAQRSAELQVKARELQIKERELGIKAYEAETSRMQATQPSVFRSPYGEGA